MQYPSHKHIVTRSLSIRSFKRQLKKTCISQIKLVILPKDTTQDGYTCHMKKNQLSTDKTQNEPLLFGTHHGIGELLKQENEIGDIIRVVANYYNDIIRCMPGNVYWLDKNCLTVGCNQNVLDMFGLKSVDDFIGLSFEEMAKIGHWNQNQAISFEKDTREVINSGKPKMNIEEPPISDPNGNFTYFLTSRVPLFNNLGEVTGVVGISTDITQRKVMEKELLKAKNIAESANRTKTEFLANMSHDVKTPMTGVVTVADLMMHTPGWCTPDKAETIYSCGLQVLNFFNSCLELSKLEMAEWSSAEEAFSLKTLLEEIYALFLPRAQSKNLKFNIEYDAALTQTLFGHRGSVYRVVLNLVGNALKFTETGEVQLRAFLEESLNEKNIRVGIEIKDTGVGIPEDQQEIIFEKLRRLTPSYEGKIEGSGIGLYIVDQYVKRMDGRITVDSAIGKGSTFTVLLPMTIASNLFFSENKKDKVLTSEANIFSQVTPTIIAPADFGGSSTDEKTLAEDAPRLLLVEDSPIIQMAACALLNDAGFQVDIASSGEEAVEIFEPSKYRLIFMDIGLPVMNGYETTQAIRAKEKTENANIPTPIFALTGHGAVDVQTFCGQAGMQGVLSKPLTREQAKMVWRRYGKGESIHVTGLTLIASSSQSMNIQIIDLTDTITLLGTEKQARDMFTLFAKELTEQFLPNVEKLIRQHNYEALRKQLHTMMGTLCYVKVPLLHQAIVDLQLAAHSSFHTIENSYKQLQREAKHFNDLYQSMKNKGEI